MRLNFRTMFLTLCLTLTAFESQAAVKPLYQDIKLPTQVMLERQYFGAPIATLATRIVSGTAGNTSAAAATLTTFSAQPDVPRNITIIPTGTTGDLEACVIVVNGTNIRNQVISENFTFLADASTTQTGNKAFKTVTSVVFPANCESGSFAATFNIGVGEKIGLNKCLDLAGDFAWSQVAGAFESTHATVVADATAIESNTADFNGTMNGSNAFIGYFVQNFRCTP